MYKDSSQLRIEDFVFPYGKLDAENDWVRLAAPVPWDVAEERYAAQFVNNGRPAHPARMALGAPLIQRRLKCSGQWLVKHIGENPYLQYFIGMKEYGPCPFGASTLAVFRKRFSEKNLAAILEASVPKGEAEGKADKIYRNRQTPAFCKEYGIRLSGPALGKPPKNPVLSRQAKKQEYQDSCDRNVVEGIFGTGKTAYALDRITAHLQETAACVIAVLLLNLSRSIRSALALFSLLSLVAILPGLRSRA